jgi:hypothetical protein
MTACTTSVALVIRPGEERFLLDCFFVRFFRVV